MELIMVNLSETKQKFLFNIHDIHYAVNSPMKQCSLIDTRANKVERKKKPPNNEVTTDIPFGSSCSTQTQNFH